MHDREHSHTQYVAERGHKIVMCLRRGKCVLYFLEASARLTPLCKKSCKRWWMFLRAQGQCHVWGKAEVSHGACVQAVIWQQAWAHSNAVSENHRSLLSYCELEELFCLWAHGSACLTLCRHNWDIKEAGKLQNTDGRGDKGLKKKS